MAQGALMLAIIRTFSPEKLELLQLAYHEEAENGLALVLNSQCSEPLREGFQAHIEAQATILNSYLP